MSEKAEPTDLVVSYTLGKSGVEEKCKQEYQRLQDALTNGYRVVDVISTASGPMGGASTSGFCFVAVTVVLVKADTSSRNLPYCKCPN